MGHVRAEPAGRAAHPLRRLWRDRLLPYLAVGAEPNSSYVVVMYATNAPGAGKWRSAESHDCWTEDRTGGVELTPSQRQFALELLDADSEERKLLILGGDDHLEAGVCLDTDLALLSRANARLVAQGFDSLAHFSIAVQIGLAQSSALGYCAEADRPLL